MAVDYFGCFGITKGINLIAINWRAWSLIFNIGAIICILVI